MLWPMAASIGFISAPDRLARRYAYQVLLVEEFQRSGAVVVFLNRTIGVLAEDDLLLHVQGVIADRNAPRSSNVATVAGAMRRKLER